MNPSRPKIIAIINKTPPTNIPYSIKSIYKTFKVIFNIKLRKENFEIY